MANDRNLTEPTTSTEQTLYGIIKRNTEIIKGKINNKEEILGVMYGTAARGYSAYQVAVQNGFEGTIEEWLQSLIGPQGEKGDQGDDYVLTQADEQEIAGIVYNNLDLSNYIKTNNVATKQNAGIIKVGNGLDINNEFLNVIYANTAQMKQQTERYSAINPANEYIATFYGLARAAGDLTQSQSANAIGTYTTQAITAIKNMLHINDNYENFNNLPTIDNTIVKGNIANYVMTPADAMTIAEIQAILES